MALSTVQGHFTKAKLPVTLETRCWEESGCPVPQPGHLLTDSVPLTNYEVRKQLLKSVHEMSSQGIRSKQAPGYQSKRQEAGETAQRVTAPGARAEDPGSVPRSYTVVQNHP